MGILLFLFGSMLGAGICIILYKIIAAKIKTEGIIKVNHTDETVIVMISSEKLMNPKCLKAVFKVDHTNDESR